MLWLGAGAMRPKKVFLNDVLIGEALTWGEVRALLKSKSIVFVGNPGMAEGPTAFHVGGGLVKRSGQRARAADEIG